MNELLPEPANYRTTNWKSYNDALRRRGSLLIWLDTIDWLVRMAVRAVKGRIGEEGGGESNRLVAEDELGEQPDGTLYQIVTLAGLALLAVLVLAFNLDIGFVSLTIGLGLALWNPTLQTRAMSQVAWPEIMLITGVSTYVAVLEHMGTIDFVGDSVAGMSASAMAT